MQVLKQRCTQQVRNEPCSGRSDGEGIWQSRFYDFNVRTEGKRMQKFRYMHANPVKRGLVTTPDRWAWSSFRQYFCQEAGAVRVNDCALMELKMGSPAA
jgi:putative transposase